MSKNKQTTQNEQKRLELTNDYVFKRIFAKPENNQELKEFVEAILDIKIKKIEVKNPEITKNYADEKLGVLDIRATIDDDTILDVEMQVSNVYTLVNRNIGYGARLIAEDTRVSETYKGLKKFISINILAENLLKRNTYHSIAHLKFEENNPKKYVDMGYKEEQEILTDKIEIHYIELFYNFSISSLLRPVISSIVFISNPFSFIFFATSFFPFFSACAIVVL